MLAVTVSWWSGAKVKSERLVVGSLRLTVDVFLVAFTELPEGKVLQYTVKESAGGAVPSPTLKDRTLVGCSFYTLVVKPKNQSKSTAGKRNFFFFK